MSGWVLLLLLVGRYFSFVSSLACHNNPLVSNFHSFPLFVYLVSDVSPNL